MSRIKQDHVTLNNGDMFGSVEVATARYDDGAYHEVSIDLRWVPNCSDRLTGASGKTEHECFISLATQWQAMAEAMLQHASSLPTEADIARAMRPMCRCCGARCTFAPDAMCSICQTPLDASDGALAECRAMGIVSP